MIIKKKKKKEDSKNKLFHFLVERIYIYIQVGYQRVIIHKFWVFVENVNTFVLWVFIFLRRKSGKDNVLPWTQGKCLYMENE